MLWNKVARLTSVGHLQVLMQWPSLVRGICVVAACAYGGALLAPSQRETIAAKTSPLVLEENEGERRVVRGWPGHSEPGESFILKVDPRNGGSSHLVFLTADLAPEGEIPTHRHPGADEILFLESGTARVQVGDLVREVHAGATVFIPADTWISVTNVGKDHIRAVGVFSAPGFEQYMREVSVREGEKNVPVTEAEDAAIAKRHSHAVVYK